jgi:hypothetical protein
MALTCGKCSRINPQEASYCYYDGSLLGGRSANGGPINVATQPFHSPFVFPSGLICRNFDQLALACQENWPVVIELLQEGYLESFLGGLGRIDLARAARDAARLPDRERGLDQFLSKLPSGVLQPPRLRVEPREISLGLVPVGEDRRFEVTLDNQGMRLLYGSVTCVDCVWLALGDAAGVQQKVFQFSGEMSLPVHVRGQYLRAGNKPLEGRLVFETNGGNATVLVRVEVPVKPFSDGVLAGALSPRQIAEKAKASPKEAAVLMESGAVARWYQGNGWTYPVQGPSASGLGAVQQFFEALGLVTPPQVDVSELTVALRGNPGQKLEHVLAVTAQEKRPVFAYATSDRQWLEVGRARLNGRTATIPLIVPAVPNQPGETLHSRVSVVGNGNQRFSVAVTLTIGGRAVAGWSTGIQPPPVRALPVLAEPVLLESVKMITPPAAVPVRIAAEPVLLEALPAEPLPRAQAGQRPPIWVYLIPVCFLALSLLWVMIHDMLLKGDIPPTFAEEEGLLDPDPRLAVHFHDKQEHVSLGTGGVKPEEGKVMADGKAALWEPSMRFGLVMLRAQDPLNPGRYKRLTFDDQGRTNNTCVRLDGQEWLFGDRPFHTADGTEVGSWPGRWKERELSLGEDRSGRRREGKQSVWVYEDDKVEITQTVEIVPGGQTRLLDTCLVRYRIDNKDTRPHDVGLRFLLDTYIGANDGVPFTIPGDKNLCDTSKEFNTRQDVPDFIQALEKEDLAHPGTIAYVQLKLGGDLDPPDRVTLGAWPNPRLPDQRCRQEKTAWEVPVFPIKSLKPADSAVTIYWNAREVKPGKPREVGFAYGLGTVASSAGGKLGLSVGGSFKPGGEFTLTALVSEPVRGQTLTLSLPGGFEIIEGDKIESVPALPADASSRNGPVAWKLRAPSRGGRYPLKVRSSTGVSQTLTVTISSRTFLD